ERAISGLPGTIFDSDVALYVDSLWNAGEQHLRLPAYLSDDCHNKCGDSAHRSHHLSIVLHVYSPLNKYLAYVAQHRRRLTAQAFVGTNCYFREQLTRATLAKSLAHFQRKYLAACAAKFTDATRGKVRDTIAHATWPALLCKYNELLDR